MYLTSASRCAVIKLENMAYFTNRFFRTGIVACVVMAAFSVPALAQPFTPGNSATTNPDVDVPGETDSQVSDSKNSDSQVAEMAYAYAASVKPEDAKEAGLHSAYTTELWISDQDLTQNARKLIRAINRAKIHGLNPQSYQADRINSVVDTLGMHIAGTQAQRKTVRQKNTRQESSDLDLDLGQQLGTLLDESFVKLVGDLGKGVVDGRKLQKRLYRDPPDVDPEQLLQSVRDAELSVEQVLASVIPTHPGYQRLTQTMKRLLMERARGVSRTLVNGPDAALIVDSEDDTALILKRLVETGDLKSADPHATLVDGLKAFQARNGLPQTGEIDEQMRLALNTGVETEIEAVAMSLERYRWLPRDMGSRHIWVNIPNFRVDVVDDNVTTLTMRAVVGRTYHQTPSFSRDMSYMEFNPTWTVPYKIAVNELVPKELNNPGYLAKRNFEYLKHENGRLVRVPADSVTRDDFRAARFPYVLRQRGGPGNALGTVKFLMPNKYAIYLHDTPAQKHFAWTSRAYSHGCIRLADPHAMAQTLMLGDGYDQTEIDRSLRSKKTHRVQLRQFVPTHLVYMTTWVDENKALQIRPDVYDNDTQLLTALREADTLISTLNTPLSGQMELALQ